MHKSHCNKTKSMVFDDKDFYNEPKKKSIISIDPVIQSSEKNNRINIEDITKNIINFLNSGKIDIKVANLNIDGDATIDQTLYAKDIISLGNIQVDNILNVNKNISSNLVNSDIIITNSIKSSYILSDYDININPPDGQTIRIPNISFGVNSEFLSSINPFMIKKNKIFIVSSNIILNADDSCNGIEIIIYNNSPNNRIIIRTSLEIVTYITPRNAKKIIFLAEINKWIVL